MAKRSFTKLERDSGMLTSRRIVVEDEDDGGDGGDDGEQT